MYVFFKNHLQRWLDSKKDGVEHATQVVIYFVCLPTIFSQQILLAFASFAFYFQWFGLVLGAYIMTLGAVRWQPVITEATFDAE